MPMVTDRNSAHERRLDIPGTTNFRDLGGYKTACGTKAIKYGLVYRSDALNLVPATVATTVLQDTLHVHHVFDLRKASELEAKPYDFEGIHRHVVSSDASLMQDWARSGKAFTAEITSDLMQKNYYDRIENFTEPYARIFRFLVDTVCATELAPEKAAEAVVYHCTAGKDRTGWMTALLLTILGVPEDTILEDFVLTNRYLQRPADATNYLGGLGMDEASMHVLWTVDPTWLQKALAYVRDKYGSVEAYVQQALHLTVEDSDTLRGALLEPASAT